MPQAMVGELTPVHQYDDWWAKREDLYGSADEGLPCGAKVRQFEAMCEQAPPHIPVAVACSANSAMQVYVAAAGYTTQRPAHVWVPKRAKLTEATKYARRMGATVHPVERGYLNVVRARCREWRQANCPQGVVSWDFNKAIEDAIAQVANIPEGCKRIIVPVGSGLICAGIIAGVTLSLRRKLRPQVLGVAVSDMATYDHIMDIAETHTAGRKLTKFTLSRHHKKYDQWDEARLPDGTLLDPWYAAKALPYVRPGDCLWVTGARPLSAYPQALRNA